MNRQRMQPGHKIAQIVAVLAIVCALGSLVQNAKAAHRDGIPVLCHSQKLGCHCWLVQQCLVRQCLGHTAGTAPALSVDAALAVNLRTQQTIDPKVEASAIESSGEFGIDDEISATQVYLPPSRWPAWLKRLWLVWLFALGASIGSFLNVVVYRLPAGKSLVTPPSHCPHCNHPIRWHDNVPILGWLILRGRCRDCHALISPRYPLVELAAGLLWAIVAQVEVFSDGINLPIAALQERAGLSAFSGTWSVLWWVYGYHVVLLSALLTAWLFDLDGRRFSLADIDRQRIPRRWFIFVLAIGFLAPLWMPAVRPIPCGWLASGHGAAARTMSSAVVDAVAGLLVAFVFAGAATLMFGRSAQNIARSLNMGMTVFWVGMFLGWQAVAALCVVCSGLVLIDRLVERLWPRGVPIVWSGWFGFCTLMWIGAWSMIDELAPGLTRSAGWPTFWVLLGITAMLAFAIRQLDRGPVDRRPTALMKSRRPQSN